MDDTAPIRQLDIGLEKVEKLGELNTIGLHLLNRFDIFLTDFIIVKLKRGHAPLLH